MSRPASAAARRRRLAALVLASILFAGVLTIRIVVDDPHEAVSLLYVIPIALIAVELGSRPGMVAATAATLLFVGWHALTETPVGPFGAFARVVAFFLAGDLLGRMASARRALEAQNARQWELSLDMLCTADFEGFFRRVNPAFEHTLGYSSAELTGRRFLDFVHPEDRDRTGEEAARLAREGVSTLDFQNRYLARDGTVHWLEWRATAVPEEQLIYGMARDITDRKLLEQEIGEMVRRDALTGLLNRRGFLEVLAFHAAQVQRHASPTTLVAIDLDGFKSVNDRFGHAAGDDILVQVAQCLRDSLRAADVVGRLGGDELLVLLPQTGLDGAQPVVHRLVATIGERLRRHGVTASVGAAVFTDVRAANEDVWLAAADNAMYEAKRAGGNRCVVAGVDPASTAGARSRASLPS